MVRVALIGAGEVARQLHAPAYKSCREAELFGVVGRTREHAETLAAMFDLRVYRTSDELFADNSIEAVSICTPPSTHRPLLEEAVAAGKHVLLEKPIATTVADVDAVAALAARAGVVVEIMHNERFMEPHEIVRSLIASGLVGTVNALQFAIATEGPEVWAPQASWFRELDAAGGGALMDLAVHKIDLACWLLDDHVADVAPALTERTHGAEDVGVISFRLSKGTYVTVTASWHGPRDASNLIVLGSEGLIRTGGYDGKVALESHAGMSEWDAVVPWSPSDWSSVAAINRFIERCAYRDLPNTIGPEWAQGTRVVLEAYT